MTNPGAMAFTRTPRPAHSVASVSREADHAALLIA